MIFKPRQIKNKDLPTFYFKEFGKEFLLTNDAGDWLFLEKEEFDRFLSGNFKKDEVLQRKLEEKNFIKNGLDQKKFALQYYSRNKSVFMGPTLNIIIPTIRCNQRCIYCHASAKGLTEVGKFDMSTETARAVVDRVFECPNRDIVIEFQGGEPLLNWPIVKFIIEYSKEKSRELKKNVETKLVSNFSLMDEKKFQYLIKNKVGFAVSFDGPEKLHNKQRIFLGGNSYKIARKWINRFSEIYPAVLKKGYIYRMGGLVTITKFSLPYYREIINEYLARGFFDVYIRPIDPFGFSQKNWKVFGYNAGDFLKFYKNLLSHIIKLNLSGKKFRERTATNFLKKILTKEDPFHMDYRSPCGAVIGQIAYNYNGDIYTCDEGRMLGMMGDDNFRIGNIFEKSYNEVIESPITKIMCIASCLEGLSGCSECVYKPYCGVCPIYNYFHDGNLFSQTPNNDRCIINKGIIDFLFENLKNKKIENIFKYWAGEEFFKEK